MGSMLARMKEVDVHEFEVPKVARRRKVDAAASPPPRQMGVTMNRAPGGLGGGRGSRGAAGVVVGGAGYAADIFQGSELDDQIKQIEDELTIKLPPLDSVVLQSNSPRQ